MNRFKFALSVLILTLSLGLYNYTQAQDANFDASSVIKRINNATVATTTAPAPAGATVQKTYTYVAPLAIVAQPKFYVGKNVKFKAKFDKFATLGLDYKPAFRSSEKYISFLIQRDDVTDHDIPLSELKIFIERKVAEKYIDLNSGDEVEICGRVFSAALGDAWMDAEKFTVLKTSPKTGK